MISPITMNSINFGNKKAVLKSADIHKIDNTESPVSGSVRYNEPSKPNSLCNKDFAMGVFLGLLLGASSLAGYKQTMRDKMLNSMKEESCESITDKIKMEDITQDGIPEIIIEGKDGKKTAYDLVSLTTYPNAIVKNTTKVDNALMWGE